MLTKYIVHCIDQDVDQDVNRVPIKSVDRHWTVDAFHIHVHDYISYEQMCMISLLIVRPT